MAKDPKRQLLGKIARQKGQYFEQRLDSTFDYYRERGYTDNTAPYFCAELVSVWKIPSVNREAFAW